MTDAEVRLFVYEQARKGLIPSPAEVSRHFDVAPIEVADSFRRLAEVEALVLLPDSPYIWMAEPFSAVPTDYPVYRGEGGRWYGNCIWDALAISALVGGDCRIDATCPQSAATLTIRTREEHLVNAAGIVHFAVPSRRWWESIGFT